MYASAAGGIPEKNYHQIDILSILPAVIQENKLKKIQLLSYS